MRIRKAAALAAFVLVLLASPAARAARLPDWARPVVEAAPPLPEEPIPDADRVLLEEIALEVRPDGTVRETRRLVGQVLGIGDVDARVVGVGHRAGVTLRRALAWHLPPGETSAIRFDRGDAVDVKASDAFLDARRVRLFEIPDVRRGSLVVSEIVRDLDSPFLAYAWRPAPGSELVRGSLAVRLPEGWKLHHEWVGGPGPEPRCAAGSCRFEVRDLPAPPRETAVPEGSRPRLCLSFEPPAGSPLRERWAGTWPEFAARLDRMWMRRDEPDDLVRARVRELLAGVPEDPWRRIGVLARDVRDRVHYVARLLDENGMVPEDAGRVLRSLQGDCKGKVALLRAMLTAAGIESWPILVRVETREDVPRKVPVPAFDHVVLAISLPEAVRVPDGLPGVVTWKGVGRVLVFDPTDELTSPGWLSGGLSGRAAVLLAGAASGPVVLPGDTPEAHRVDADVSVTVEEDGRFRVVGVLEARGEPARRCRREVREKGQEGIEERFATFLSMNWPGAKLEEVRVVEETDEGTCRKEVRWSAPVKHEADGSDWVPVVPVPDPFPPLPALRRRRAPLAIDHPVAVRIESRIAGLPAGIVLPEPDEREGDGWRLLVTWQREGELVHGLLEAVLERRVYSPESFRGLRRLQAAWRRARGRTLFAGER